MIYILDFGGNDKLRDLLHLYYGHTQGIIFVVDCKDRQRINDQFGIGYDYSAKGILDEMLSDIQLKDVPLVIMANKVDLPNAMDINEVTEKLGLNELKDRQWFIQSTCALTGDGLYESLDWLASQPVVNPQTFLTTMTEMKGKAGKWLQNSLHSVKEELVERKRLQENAKIQKDKIKREKERDKWDRIRKVNKTKSVLLISGWMRCAEIKVNLFSSISADITKLIHLFYHDHNEYYEEYPFYGEYRKSNGDNMVNGVCRKKPSLLMRFVNRRHNDPNYIKNDDVFIRFIEENGKFPSELYGDDNVDYEWMQYKKQDIEWMKHYDFMRMIWIFQVQYGRRNGMKRIWKLTPFDTTTTYFWAQSIYFGLNNSSKEETLKLLCSDFEYLLIMNPYLVEDYKHLMERYYSKSLLAVIGGEKKEEMVLPDLLPLPSMMTDIARLKVKKAKVEQTKSDNIESKENSFAEDDDDDSFIKSFESRSFKCWSGHESFIRVIWCYLNQFDGEKGCVEKIQSEWKRFCGAEFHETIMCFWIHMVRYWRALFTEHIGDSGKMKCTFNSFLVFRGKHKNRCKMLDENWWNQYYSESVMYRKGFHGLDASQQMVFPDKNSLPQLRLSKLSPKKRL